MSFLRRRRLASLSRIEVSSRCILFSIDAGNGLIDQVFRARNFVLMIRFGSYLRIIILDVRLNRIMDHFINAAVGLLLLLAVDILQVPGCYNVFILINVEFATIVSVLIFDILMNFADDVHILFIHRIRVNGAYNGR